MFTYKFAAIQRIDRTNTIVKLSVTANTEREARRQFASDYILFFAAKIRAGGRYVV
jgi:hypothetical protein